MNLAWGRIRSIRGLGLSRIHVGIGMEKLCPLVAVPEGVLLLSLLISVMRECFWALQYFLSRASAELGGFFVQSFRYRHWWFRPASSCIYGHCRLQAVLRTDLTMGCGRLCQLVGHCRDNGKGYIQCPPCIRYVCNSQLHLEIARDC